MPSTPDPPSNPVFDIIVVGAGPAGTQAAVSAAHQMRHVLLLDGGGVSRNRGRAYWSKSVQILDAPVFTGVTGPNFARALAEWAYAQPERCATIGGTDRWVGIRRVDGIANGLQRAADGLWELECSILPLDREGRQQATYSTRSRQVIVASGFEDGWPDIEREKGAKRMYERYRTVYRYAGNRRGWHVCIRCDGHLHLDEHLAIVGVGDYIFDVVQGAQDFTDRITVLTNGRPHGMSGRVVRELERRGAGLDEGRIDAHIGRGTDLLGFKMRDGRELYFDGFFVDEGLTANDGFLAGLDVQHNGEGLIVADDDHRVIAADGTVIEGLWACGDIVAGERNLIASAFGSGQDAGLGASDGLRRWPSVA